MNSLSVGNPEFNPKPHSPECPSMQQLYEFSRRAESFFVQEQVLSRLRSGPMGPYLPDLAVQLVQQHYARRTGCILLRTADRLGRWLAQEGVALTDATAVHLKSFAASQGRRDTGVCLRRSGAFPALPNYSSLVAFWLALHHSPPAINGYADSTNTCCMYKASQPRHAATIFVTHIV